MYQKRLRPAGDVSTNAPKETDMSHFTVAIRVPAAVELTELSDRIDQMLIPYKEKDCGDEDPEELKQYLKFDDCTEEVLKGWAEKEGEANYETVEEYAKDYHGYVSHEGKFGRWHNPNQKWDWFQVGGRWSGMLPVKISAQTSAFHGERSWMNRNDPVDPGTADGCRIEDIDFDAVATETRQKMSDFWREWTAATAGDEVVLNDFHGPRSTALAIGLLACKDATELTGAEWKTSKWSRQNTPGVDRFDVFKQVSEEEFFRDYEKHFVSIKAYARLDQDGWKEPGEMGWFGVSYATPESREAYRKDFLGWLRAGDQRDWVVIVDCHI
jgi:hypothetical protein